MLLFVVQDQSAISHEHQLPDGCILELLEMRPASTDPTTRAQPPLLFIHGASHGAWCWSVSMSVMPVKLHCMSHMGVSRVLHCVFTWFTWSTLYKGTC